MTTNDGMADSDYTHLMADIFTDHQPGMPLGESRADAIFTPAFGYCGAESTLFDPGTGETKECICIRDAHDSDPDQHAFIPSDSLFTLGS